MNPLPHAAIGAVDIGGTKIDAALVDPAGRVLARRSLPTQMAGLPEKALGDIIAMLRDCVNETGIAVLGVGVGCTGPVYPATGMVGAVDLLPGWKGFELTKALSVSLGMPVVLENDADAGALAEARWGAGRGATRFLYVSIGTGIGVGIVLDGQLYRGAGGAHPEPGHQTIELSGPACYCGATGCWEVLASGTAMEAWARSVWPAPTESAPDTKGKLDGRRIVALARQGDPLALSVVDREARYIGIGLANLITSFSPDALAVGGGLMAAADLLLPAAIAEVQKRCKLVPLDAVSITVARLGPDVALLGAAQAFLHAYPQYGNAQS